MQGANPCPSSRKLRPQEHDIQEYSLVTYDMLERQKNGYIQPNIRIRFGIHYRHTTDDSPL